MNFSPNASMNQNRRRAVNTAMVLDLVRRQAPVTRAAVAAGTGLNRSALSSIIGGLLEAGLVQEAPRPPARVGQPGVLLELNPGAGCAVDVEVGAGYLSVILTNFAAHVLWHQRIDVEPDDGRTKILEQAYVLTEAALKEGRSRQLRPLGIGVGVPDVVDVREGMLRLTPNLGWENTPLRLMWTQRFNLPVYVENNENAATLGEAYFGAARNIENVIYLNTGPSLGAGVLIGGKIFRGNRGSTVEIGHMTLDPHGEVCGCGKRGCLETLVGPGAVVRRVQQAIGRGRQEAFWPTKGATSGGITFDRIVETAREGDAIALAALQETGHYLGLGIANLIGIFNPQMVVLGGTLSLASDVLLPIVVRVVEDNAVGVLNTAVKITTSAHGVEAGGMGAVALVLDNLLHLPTLA